MNTTSCTGLLNAVYGGRTQTGLIDLLSRLYLPVTFTLKLKSSKVRSTNVKSAYILRMFHQDDSDGQLALPTAVRLGVVLITTRNKEKRDDVDERRDGHLYLFIYLIQIILPLKS